MPGVAIITEAGDGLIENSHVPNGTAKHAYNSADVHKGHDHTFFIQHNGAVFAD